MSPAGSTRHKDNFNWKSYSFHNTRPRYYARMWLWSTCTNLHNLTYLLRALCGRKTATSPKQTINSFFFFHFSRDCECVCVCSSRNFCGLVGVLYGSAFVCLSCACAPELIAFYIVLCLTITATIQLLSPFASIVFH